MAWNAYTALPSSTSLCPFAASILDPSKWTQKGRLYDGITEERTMLARCSVMEQREAWMAVSVLFTLNFKYSGISGHEYSLILP